MKTHIFINKNTKRILVITINDLETAKQFVLDRFIGFVYKSSIEEHQVLIISPNELNE